MCGLSWGLPVCLALTAIADTDPTTAPASPQETFDLWARRASHWAWSPLKETDEPRASTPDWPLDPLDRYILAGLDRAGLKPAADASRSALLRRIYFDLTGLPPPADVAEAFAESGGEDDYKRIVDQLLASPRFGERWARHWLDVVRYAETMGHEFDYSIPHAFEYRDYVIRALNADVPYDQFVTEHIAGDLLPESRLDPATGADESILGTGFWFLGEAVHSPVDTRQDELDHLDNMIDTFGKAFLGLTVSCARCHDHKFDAISSRDYYALAGFLLSSSYRQARFETCASDAATAASLESLREEHERSVRPLIAAAMRRDVERLDISQGAVTAATAFDELAPGLTGLLASGQDYLDRKAAWLRSITDPPPATHDRSPGEHLVFDFGAATPSEWLRDGPAYGSGPTRAGQWWPPVDDSNALGSVVTEAGAEVRSEWLFLHGPVGDEREPGRIGAWVRPGRMIRTPTFEIGPSGLLWHRVRGSGVAYAVVESHRLNEGPLHGSMLRPMQESSGWRWERHDLSRYIGRRAHVEFFPAEPADAGIEHRSGFAVSRIVESTNQPSEPLERRMLIEIVRASDDGGSLAVGLKRLLDRACDELASPTMADPTARAELASIADWMLRHLVEIDPDAADSVTGLTEEAARYRAERSRLVNNIRADSRSAPAMLDGSAVNERLLPRGDHRLAGPGVDRRFLEALAGHDPIRDEGSGRLQLARQVTDPSINPLLGRVMVNRVWHHLLGRGIVASTDNLGVLGDRPTHPELLDRLALDLIADGWSIKRLIRRIVLSRTYRMATDGGDDAAESIDPANDLLHRAHVRRLEAEAIRDAMLAVTGRLDLTMFGPSIPVHLSEHMQGRGRPAESGPLDGAGRRSIYQEVRRNFPSPLMLAFDTPIPFQPVGRRTVSNVPAQALILMNDPFVIGQAALWGERTTKEGPPHGSTGHDETHRRIVRMYLHAFGRRPTGAELGRAKSFLAERSASYDIAPVGLNGPSDTDTQGLNRDPRPWADLAHVLFNVKEFIFLY